MCEDLDLLGSGFFIEGGLFITNNHVIRKIAPGPSGEIQRIYSDEVYIQKDGNKYEASLLIDEDSDPPIVYDYAVLKVECEPMASLELGDASEVSSGDEVIAVGYSLDFEVPVVTKGIVSAIRKQPSHINTLHQIKMILTDTTINKGNSGGPLVRKSDGKVIGINTMHHPFVDQGRLSQFKEILGEGDSPCEAIVKELIGYISKYVTTGLNHAVAVDHLIDDSILDLGAR